jgi:hypothetical protein
MAKTPKLDVQCEINGEIVRLIVSCSKRDVHKYCRQKYGATRVISFKERISKLSLFNENAVTLMD